MQRPRIDIVGRDWAEGRVFPRHEIKESPYRLSNDHKAFHDAVLDYCLGVVEGAGPDSNGAGAHSGARWRSCAVSGRRRRPRPSCAIVLPLGRPP